MLQAVLVALDESPFSDSATTLALEWGTRFGARLLGLGILDKPSITAPEPVPLGASFFKRERDEARLADAQKLVETILSKFQQRYSAAGVAAEAFEPVSGFGGGETVHLVTVRHDDSKDGAPAELAAELLEAHGIQCKVQGVKSDCAFRMASDAGWLCSQP